MKLYQSLRKFNFYNNFNALEKKSFWPKFPDLRAIFTDLFGSHIVGTPAEISSPICSSLIPSPLTTAPEVSPPAATIFLKFNGRFQSEPYIPFIANETDTLLGFRVSI